MGHWFLHQPGAAGASGGVSATDGSGPRGEWEAMSSNKRVGVFGGTFDPVHLGHLILAEQCREQAGLDQVLFVPSARPPHKQDRTLAPFDRRVEMLQLALAGQPAFQVSTMEAERPGLSYTVETLSVLRAARSDAELFLIIGSDTVADLPQWRDPARIVELAALLIVARPDWPTSS